MKYLADVLQLNVSLGLGLSLLGFKFYRYPKNLLHFVSDPFEKEDNTFLADKMILSDSNDSKASFDSSKTSSSVNARVCLIRVHM